MVVAPESQVSESQQIRQLESRFKPLVPETAHRVRTTRPHNVQPVTREQSPVAGPSWQIAASLHELSPDTSFLTLRLFERALLTLPRPGTAAR
jgi:hypothetical protein